MPATPPLFHDHIDVVLDDGNCLRYHDPRRFGSHWLDSPAHPLLDHLGPEPLSTAFSGAYLYERHAAGSYRLNSSLWMARSSWGGQYLRQ